MATQCEHLKEVRDVKPRTPQGCEECLAMGSGWVHLRLCLECGHVGCCDSSPHRHATQHFHATRHPMMRSLEPGEDWGWCFVDEILYEPAPRSRKP
jgi:uncharacterized UBP type Zn finger protein